MSKVREEALEIVIRVYGFENEKTVMFAAMCEDPYISEKGLMELAHKYQETEYIEEDF